MSHNYSYNVVSKEEPKADVPLVYDVTHSVSSQHERHPFPFLRNMWLSIFYLLLLVTNEVMVVVDQKIINLTTNNIRYIVVQAGLLFFISLTYVIHRHEHRRARMGGYLSLYVIATRWIRAGLLVHANAACLICVANVTIDPDKEGFEEAMIIAVTIQNALLFYIYANHALVCMKHNQARALPDAITETSLPSSLSSNLLPVTPNRVVLTQKELLTKQAVLIQGLEAQVRSLGEELVKVKGRAHPSNASKRVNPELVRQQEEEIRALNMEKDVLRRDLHLAQDEAGDLKKMNDMLLRENEEHASTICRQKKQIRLLQKEKSQLKILNEVHKETNANARKAIESLAGGSNSLPLSMVASSAPSSHGLESP